MWVPDGCQSVVNRGDGGERIFSTDDDRRCFLGCLSELTGIGVAEGAGPTQGLDAGHGGMRGGEAWWVEALGVGWTDCRTEVRRRVKG
jgi:hypothetical protein